MASLSFIIGIIGNVISILVFASPIKTFWRVVKKKSTENYNGVLYITNLLSASLWTFYGTITPDGLLLITVNVTGAIFHLIYVTLFLIYAPRDKKIKTAKLVAVLDVGFLGVLIAVALLAIHGDTRLTFVGILCAVFSVIVYASPLLVMKTVVRTKSVEYMPFLLSLILLFNGGIWTFYALLAKDYFVRVPNGIGFFLGTIQLLLYARYWKPQKLKKMSENLVEGWQHDQPLNNSSLISSPLPKRSAD
ncbi:bidirectional sugar transporter SWEET16-like [Herrania umbratica]|uniref:Bidirectional sugar transporter SWEET n=1 Tax=Herrania umbratica TaxID=108875 RepID=A0A6J1A854_9ROSI|nr:bidirectional sugar transporter SWEET16-like [Herrania umbratica]